MFLKPNSMAQRPGMHSGKNQQKSESKLNCGVILIPQRDFLKNLFILVMILIRFLSNFNLIKYYYCFEQSLFRKNVLSYLG